MNWYKIGTALVVYLFFAVGVVGTFQLGLSFLAWEILPFSWLFFRLMSILGLIMAIVFWFTTDEKGNVK